MKVMIIDNTMEDAWYRRFFLGELLRRGHEVVAYLFTRSRRASRPGKPRNSSGSRTDRKGRNGTAKASMKIFIATFVVLGITVLAMALGVILSNRRIKGSCGGLAALGIEKACDCDRPCERRRKLDEANRHRIEVRQ